MAAGLLFDWLYPAHFPTILASLEAWADTPEVSTPILKFMAEFVLNKTQRLAFDASSASGILLFREVSKVRPPAWPGLRVQGLRLPGLCPGEPRVHVLEEQHQFL